MRKLGQDGVTPTDRKVALISLDSFYKVLTPEESKAAYAGAYNFDRPGTAETRQMCSCPLFADGASRSFLSLVMAVRQMPLTLIS